MRYGSSHLPFWFLSHPSSVLSLRTGNTPLWQFISLIGQLICFAGGITGNDMGPEREKTEALGGEDEREKEEKEPRGCDKKDHFNRSLFHQENHRKHIKDIEQKFMIRPNEF